MFIVNSYLLAVILCFVTMLCWGSWGNTQKLAAKSWRYELFYWDYVIGMVLFSLLLAFTAGSIGSEGRPFLQDLGQAAWSNIGWVVLGGVIFNISNILLAASTSIAGLSVAFPVGVGLALVLGVINNYRVAIEQGSKTGNVGLLALGVALVVCAVVCNGVAAGKKGDSGVSKKDQRKGIILAVIAGVVMSFFSSFVMRAMDTANFVAPEAGKLTISKKFWGLVGEFNSWGELSDIFMMYDGAKWCAYNQKVSGMWKLRQASNWDVNRGGTFAPAGTPFEAVAGGDNINVGDMTGFAVLYDPVAETITIQ